MAKILIVEDYSVLARMYQKKFTDDGYEVAVALDGEQGLQRVEGFKPDLILLDIMMPKMSGLEMLKKLKEDPRTSAIPVILLTNVGGGQEVLEKGLELGAVAYLVKTDYPPRQVVDYVEDIIESYARGVPQVAERKEEIVRKEREREEKERTKEAAERQITQADLALDLARQKMEKTTRKMEAMQKATTPKEAVEALQQEIRRAETEFERAAQKAKRAARKFEKIEEK